MKRFHREHNQIAYMKNYTVRLSHGDAKLIQQSHSKEKTLQKMMTSRLTERAVSDKTLSFYFSPSGMISPLIIMVQNVTSNKQNTGLASTTI